MALDPIVLCSAAAVGFLLSAPIGPVSLLSMGRALSGSPIAAFATGAGVAACDVAIAAAALVGTRAIPLIIEAGGDLLLAASGAILLAASWSGLRRKPSDLAGAWASRSRAARSLALGALAFQGFAISLGNPLNAAAVATLSAALLAVGPSTGVPAVLTAFALGCLLWWAALSALFFRLRRIASPQLLAKLNMTVSLLLGGLGAGAVALAAIRFLSGSAG